MQRRLIGRAAAAGTDAPTSSVKMPTAASAIERERLPVGTGARIVDLLWPGAAGGVV